MQPGPCAKSTGRSQRLAKGTHQQRHLVRGQTQLGNTATTILAEHTNAMGIIHHQQCIMSPADARQLPQRSHIAIHTEHPVGHHQLVAGGIRQHGFQCICIAVGIGTDRGPGQPATVNDRGMIKRIGENRVALAREGRNDPQVRHVSGREKQRILVPGERGELFLQLMMGPVVAANQMG